jgi:hypothetical protein
VRTACAESHGKAFAQIAIGKLSLAGKLIDASRYLLPLGK